MKRMRSIVLVLALAGAVVLIIVWIRHLPSVAETKAYDRLKTQFISENAVLAVLPQSAFQSLRRDDAIGLIREVCGSRDDIVFDGNHRLAIINPEGYNGDHGSSDTVLLFDLRDETIAPVVWYSPDPARIDRPQFSASGLTLHITKAEGQDGGTSSSRTEFFIKWPPGTVPRPGIIDS